MGQMWPDRPAHVGTIRRFQKVGEGEGGVRDPRQDPRPGDVLAKRKLVKVIRTSKQPVRAGFVTIIHTYESEDPDSAVSGVRENYCYSLKDFRRWANSGKGARIVRHADIPSVAELVKEHGADEVLGEGRVQ